MSSWRALATESWNLAKAGSSSDTEPPKTPIKGEVGVPREEGVTLNGDAAAEAPRLIPLANRHASMLRASADQPAMASPTFWQPYVLDDIKIHVKLDPRVAMWASTLDAHALKALGFNSDNKYTLPAQRALYQQIEEVVACINDDCELVSTYSQFGKPFDFHAKKGKVTELQPCIRSLFLGSYRDLDVSSAQHRTHEQTTRHLLPHLWEETRWFWADLKNPATRSRLASQLSTSVEAAKEHLNSIWNSFEPRKGVRNSTFFRELEETAWRIRTHLFNVPELRWIRDIATSEKKDDPVRIHGSFMSRVYAFVIRKALLAARHEIGVDSVMTLIHDGCHVDSEDSDDVIVAKAGAACQKLMGDPLKWSIKPHEDRIRIHGKRSFSDVRLSINLEEYDEENFEVKLEASDEFVDPQQIARSLGTALSKLYKTRMKRARLEELVAEAKEAAFAAMNRRYKLVDDCYIDTQIDHPARGFKMIALKKFSRELKCTSVEYTEDGRMKSFNLAAKFEEWNRQERYEKLCFHPSHTPPRHFNTWTPFDASQMAPLTIEQRNAIAHRLVRVFTHIKYLSGERPYDFMMIVLWIANMLQHPETKSLCLVLLSAEGVGKSMFTRLLQKMIGKTKTLRTSSPENNVWGKFNSLMIGKFLVELAEISKANMHHQYEKVLNILEDDSFPVECKGVDGFELDSLHHFILNSNNLGACPPGRRWLLIRSSDRYAANLDCKHCKKRMIDTEGEELLCEACVELDGYHAKNYKAFDDLCAKALYEFCMRLERVPEKLTSTNVRDNEATAHVKQAAKDSIDAFLEHWLYSHHPEVFNDSASGLALKNDVEAVAPKALHDEFINFTSVKRDELTDLQSFQSRLGRKKLHSVVKKRMPVEDSTYRPYMYVISLRKLADELGIASDTCGRKGVLAERLELRKQLEEARRVKQQGIFRFEKGGAHSTWSQCKADESTFGRQIKNEKLAKTLEQGCGCVFIDREDWKAFGITELVKGDAIKYRTESGRDKCFVCIYVAPPPRIEGVDGEIEACEEKLRQLDSTIDARLASEFDEDGTAAAGNMVPSEWLTFYNDVAGRVDQFLDNLFAEGQGNS